MKTFKQFITEKIYDYEVEGFMKKKPEHANDIIKAVRDARADGKTVGFRSDKTEPGQREITHRSSEWDGGSRGGVGHKQSETKIDGVHYTPVHKDADDHEIIRRALTHRRYRTSNLGKVENNFHVVTGEHDHAGTKELDKRRSGTMHPRDAEDERKEYPEGILNKPEIAHTVTYKDMWK